MKLEKALKNFSPKSQIYSDSPRATSSDGLSSADMMAGLGYTESKASFGIGAFLGKTGISKEDADKTVERLTHFAMQQAPKYKHVGKVAGRRFASCMTILAKLAYEEYSNSAAATTSCSCCAGKGSLIVTRDVVKYPGYFSIDGEEKIPPIIEQQQVREKCKSCKGKGVISNRCRCGGAGKVLDREKTKEAGTAILKVCERCAGRGYKRTPSSVGYSAIKALLPELTQSSWSRNWKPLFEMLVSKCDQEENYANDIFDKVTR